MIKLLTSSSFKFFIIPLVTILLTIFVKFVSRNDRFSNIKKEDFAFGIDISVTALILYAMDNVTFASKIVKPNMAEIDLFKNKMLLIPWIILIFIFALWIMSTMIRKFGWENDNELHLTWGVVVPDAIGVSLLTLILLLIG